ncbi:MAG: hypothetical protein MZW92_50725 [Comamonadaceae bacterium]|nr:hypothetical protein [Comamonadaceae bacterium]
MGEVVRRFRIALRFIRDTSAHHPPPRDRAADGVLLGHDRRLRAARDHSRRHDPRRVQGRKAAYRPGIFSEYVGTKPG